MGAWEDVDGDSGREVRTGAKPGYGAASEPTVPGRIPKRYRRILSRAAVRRANECQASIHCWNQRDGDDPYCTACRAKRPQNELFPEG